MIAILKRILHGEKSSSSIAKRRLQLVLITDRRDNMPTSVMESLRDDIIEVISKYMDVDEGCVKIDLERDNDSVALVSSIPIKRIRYST